MVSSAGERVDVHGPAERPGCAWGWWVVVALACAMMPMGARASSEDSVSLGGDAALLGGAGLALVGQGNATWYNPAGLARLDGITIDLSASMYAVTSRSLQGAAVTTLPWGTLRSSSGTTGFTSVPSTLAASYQLTSRLGLGLGVFVPSRRDFSFTADDRSTGTFADQPTTYEQNAFFRGTNERMYFGAALGIKVGDWLRLGFAAFGLREMEEVNFQLAVTLHQAMDPMATQGAFGVASLHEQQQVFGVRGSTGMQLELASSFSLAVMLWTPVLSIFDSGEFTAITGAANRLPGVMSTQELQVVTTQNKPRRCFVPLRIAGGVAFSPANWYFTGEIDFRPGGRHGFDEEFQSVLNARVGLMRTLSPNFWLAGGLFTDRTDRPPNSGDGSTYYGATAGLKYRPRRMRQRVAREHRDRSWDIVGTVGVRYSRGTGELQLITLSANPLDPTPAQPRSGRMTEHEVQVQFGTSLVY
jgi:hypothetical protein